MMKSMGFFPCVLRLTGVGSLLVFVVLLFVVVGGVVSGVFSGLFGWCVLGVVCVGVVFTGVLVVVLVVGWCEEKKDFKRKQAVIREYYQYHGLSRGYDLDN